MPLQNASSGICRFNEAERITDRAKRIAFGEVRAKGQTGDLEVKGVPWNVVAGNTAVCGCGLGCTWRDGCEANSPVWVS
jgi:hypothetical protein